MDNSLIIRFRNVKKNEEFDIEVPVDITANELIYGLKKSFNLDINMDDSKQCYLRAENPIALIKGEAQLEQLGLRDGSVVFYER
ncbi:WXG100 protein secretion system (Wss), protein YukD [Pseudobutyrivibrio sp. YE44]|uniref:EsaB/YukD family protein n=1 Tax=Pseudobutyrivibrio sp. YE44 TaxID=1520802 RepID=UPI0008867C53|nr:EsaB/YukD family protein [Pseudobutyrivibrio sp. YE44]SDB40188.1 WXG100 protein secretion system (Wss), protein YukD [Pseudobutyrivibrio sp. YE44]